MADVDVTARTTFTDAVFFNSFVEPATEPRRPLPGFPSFEDAPFRGWIDASPNDDERPLNAP